MHPHDQRQMSGRYLRQGANVLLDVCVFVYLSVCVSVCLCICLLASLRRTTDQICMNILTHNVHLEKEVTTKF